jgi:uncharacterized protein (TIRG00374 family)
MAETSTASGGRPWRRIVLVLANVAVTAAIFGYLFRHVRPGEVLNLLRNLDRRAVAMFVVLSLGASIFRLWRYRILLRLSGHDAPPFPLFLMVLVRNAFSDLLPARLGTLIDVYFFTTRLGVPFPAAASCFSLTFIFEILALAPLIALAAWRAGAAGALPAGGLLLGGIVLLALTGGIVALMPWGFRLGARLAERLLPARWAFRTWASTTLDAIGGEIRHVQSAGLYGRVLALSVMLRVAKYASLYVFLFALLAPMGYTWAQLDAPRVFLGLCASELAASLPVSGIAGFGAYEGAWAAVFQLLGFPKDIAQVTSVAHHLFTQAYGYGLGGLAMAALLLPAWRRMRAAPAATPVRDRPAAFYAKIAAAAAILAAAILALAALPASAARTGGTGDRPGPADAVRRAEFAGAFGGDLLFDSTRSGTFGIWRMSADGLRTAAVADTPAHEMYPDPSPDGRWIAYARAATLSAKSPSEIRICRADGSEDRKLADDGTFPTFGPDSATVFFERDRLRVMAVRFDGGEPREVFPGPNRTWRHHVVKPRVSPDGRRVAFISNRGSMIGWNAWTAVLESGEASRLGSGCQPGWFPDGRRAVHIVERGMKASTGIVARDLPNGTASVLQDHGEPFGREYFPTVTPDGRWLLWGACGAGEHDHLSLKSNYQLFARAIAGGEVIRLTFDGWNNRWPKRIPAPGAGTGTSTKGSGP